MRFSNAKARRELPVITMTSLVDIIFNLLIFFLLTTSFSENAGLQVELPSASESDLTPGGDDLIIGITEGGDVVIAGQLLGEGELDGALARFKDNHPQGMILLQADERVAHGKVVEIIDAIKRLGIKSVGVAVQR